MTLFDLIAVLILGVSALVGFVRGATREVSTVVAFVIAAFLSVFLLRFTGPIARGAIHVGWLANGVAILVMFAAAYIVLRVLAGSLTRHIHSQSALGTADRVIGVGFGLVRGLVLLGVFNLVFSIATPPERVPHWVKDAAFYPLSRACGTMLKVLAPKGSAVAKKVGPAIERAVKDDGSEADAPNVEQAPAAEAPPHGQQRRGGYDAHARRGVDDLVEKTR